MKATFFSGLAAAALLVTTTWSYAQIAASAVSPATPPPAPANNPAVSPATPQPAPASTPAVPASTPSAPGSDTPPAAPQTDVGLLREGLNEPSQPQSTTVAEATPGPTPATRSGSVVHHHVRRHRHHVQATSTRSEVAAVEPRVQRNPVVKFVYWWNGWVIRTLHTKVGAVLLGTIGAKA